MSSNHFDENSKNEYRVNLVEESNENKTREAEVANIDHSEKKLEKKCFFVVLNDGISVLNLTTYYIVQFTYVMAFTFIDSCQPYLLVEKEYYTIPDGSEGKTNAQILLWDTLYLVKNKYLK